MNILVCTHTHSDAHYKSYITPHAQLHYTLRVHIHVHTHAFTRQHLCTWSLKSLQDNCLGAFWMFESLPDFTVSCPVCLNAYYGYPTYPQHFCGM